MDEKIPPAEHDVIWVWIQKGNHRSKMIVGCHPRANVIFAAWKWAGIGNVLHVRIVLPLMISGPTNDREPPGINQWPTVLTHPSAGGLRINEHQGSPQIDLNVWLINWKRCIQS